MGLAVECELTLVAALLQGSFVFCFFLSKSSLLADIPDSLLLIAGARLFKACGGWLDPLFMYKGVSLGLRYCSKVSFN